VPFLFGLVVIIPPQAYFGMLTNTDADRSWWGQYAYFWTHWENPDNYVGWWTPGHLWFVLFLLVYALLAVGLFVWMRRGGGHQVVDWFAAACRIPGMVIVVPAAILLAQQALVPMDDISGQSPVGFFLLFLIGFVMVAYVVVQWGVGIPVKFALIAATSFALIVAVYEVAVRRWAVVRPLFGMKPKRRRTS